MFLNHDPGIYDYYNSTIGDLYLDIKKTFGVGPMAPSAEIVIQPNRGFGSVLSNEHGGVGNNILTQAQVSVPLSTTKNFETGLMTSLAGYEVQPSNQMLTLTHGLLYDFSEPGNMVGIGLKGADATFTHFWQVLLGNEQLRTAGAIVNAANNTTKTNWTPTLTARYDSATIDRTRHWRLWYDRPADTVLAVRGRGWIWLPVRRIVSFRPVHLCGERRDVHAR